jgi:hypothetical protein
MVQAHNRCVCCISLPGISSILLMLFLAPIDLSLRLNPYSEVVFLCSLAARKYYDETPKEDRSDEGVTAVMRSAAKSKQQSFKGQFSKYLAVANPKFGDKFLDEVSAFLHSLLQFFPLYYFSNDWHHMTFIQITRHWSNNEKPEMTLEKLQSISTASAAPHFKIRWLEFWNSSLHSRQAVHFPAKGVTERDLDAWLNKACFWVGVCNQFLYTL